jgi:uncharacterized repeat protein (TIGR01451 family)
VKAHNSFKLMPTVILLSFACLLVGGAAAEEDSSLAYASTLNTDDDLVFLHQSVGWRWLGHGLHDALLAKSYIDERNDISFEAVLSPDPGRPSSLGDLPGYAMGMNHWILWFNDYLEGIKSYDSADGFNRIILFKSCFTSNNIPADGTEPGDPFSYDKTVTNYKAAYRHPEGPGHTYVWGHNGYTYKPLEDIFAENPDTLFVPITAPPRHYAPEDGTNDAEAHRARVFQDWLVDEWLPSYNAAHPGLNNVAVFHWFDFLAYPDDQPLHPNRLKQEYGGDSGVSYPNIPANWASTEVFATNPDNFLDNAWTDFLSTTSYVEAGKRASLETATLGETIAYSIVVRGFSASPTATVHLTDEVPAGLAYAPGTLSATSGTVDDAMAPALYWAGTLNPTSIVTVTYDTTVDTAEPQDVTNLATVAAPGAQPLTVSATVTIAPGPGYPELSSSYKAAYPRLVSHGDQVTYTIVIRNSTGPLTDTVHLTDTIQPGLSYVPETLTATTGSFTDTTAPTLYWSGVLSPTPAVTITYVATVSTIGPQRLINVAGLGVRSEHYTLEAEIHANFYPIFLPLLLKDSP